MRAHKRSRAQLPAGIADRADQGWGLSPKGDTPRGYGHSLPKTGFSGLAYVGVALVLAASGLLMKFLGRRPAGR
ncbi:LPXTG-motif cell wall-anchored protein [Streptomyces sp. TLI_235]|nr:LPXTG-motif cell wall-anchored protein [Streptomyces sp. TLI_235]